MALLSTDPVTVRLTDTNDLDLTGGLVLVSGLEAVSIGIRTRLLLFRGEWFLDLDAGVPWLERDNVLASEAILGQRFNEAKARVAMESAILTTPGVVEIRSLVIAFDNGTRAMSVTWSVRTAFGDTDADTLELS